VLLNDSRPVIVTVPAVADCPRTRSVPLLLNTSLPAPKSLLLLALKVPLLFTVSPLAVSRMRPLIVPLLLTVAGPPAIDSA
jgi:hypothetical protein